MNAFVENVQVAMIFVDGICVDDNRVLVNLLDLFANKVISIMLYRWKLTIVMLVNCDGTRPKEKNATSFLIFVERMQKNILRMV